MHKADARARAVESLVPSKANLKLFNAWCYWRFVSCPTYLRARLGIEIVFGRAKNFFFVFQFHLRYVA